MAERPVFKPTLKSDDFVETINIEFQWFAGFAVSQKQKSIRSLHEEAMATHKVNKNLEISEFRWLGIYIPQIMQKTSPTHPENITKPSRKHHQNIQKTSPKHPENIQKTSPKHPAFTQ